MGYQELYKQKLVTAEEAVKIVKPGMWIDYGFCNTHPIALDKALAARMEAEPDLAPLNFRGGIALYTPAVTQVTDAEKRMNWNSWHTSGIERKLVEKGYGYYNILRYSGLKRSRSGSIRLYQLLNDG